MFVKQRETRAERREGVHQNIERFDQTNAKDWYGKKRLY